MEAKKLLVQQNQRGTVLIELALLAPLFLILLGAAVDLGLMFREEQQLVEAVRVAGRAVGGFIPVPANAADDLCVVAKKGVKDSFGESNVGDMTITLENVDLNSGGSIPGGGVLKAVKITVQRDASDRPSFFKRFFFNTGASGTFYLESQQSVSNGCDP